MNEKGRLGGGMCVYGECRPSVPDLALENSGMKRWEGFIHDVMPL